MEPYIIALLLAILCLLVLLSFRVLLSKGGEQPEQAMLLVQSALNGLTQTFTAGSRQIIEKLNSELANVALQVADAKQSTDKVFSFAVQLQGLENVLINPGPRGKLGEVGLELVLSNVLPPDTYKMKHTFKDGAIVDAVIMAQEGIIPIDAKFPFDNYVGIAKETDETRRGKLEEQFLDGLKKRIDETSKYVRPTENTLAFAFMFIPAEGIYYDLLVNEIGTLKVNTRSLIDYAHEKKVIIVSPTTFAAYLHSVLYGFKAFKIERTAGEIKRNVERLAGHLRAYEEYFKRVGITLSTTVNHYNAAYAELGRIDTDVVRITGQRIGVEPLTVARPQMDVANSALERGDSSSIK